LDKVLIDTIYQTGKLLLKNYQREKPFNVTVLGDDAKATNVPQIESDLIWYEEFLDYKIVIKVPF
jgi:glutamate-5-semialdehyde dehydrogenase